MKLICDAKNRNNREGSNQKNTKAKMKHSCRDDHSTTGIRTVVRLPQITKTRITPPQRQRKHGTNNSECESKLLLVTTHSNLDSYHFFTRFFALDQHGVPRRRVPRVTYKKETFWRHCTDAPNFPQGQTQTDLLTIRLLNSRLDRGTRNYAIQCQIPKTYVKQRLALDPWTSRCASPTDPRC